MPLPARSRQIPVIKHQDNHPSTSTISSQAREQANGRGVTRVLSTASGSGHERACTDRRLSIISTAKHRDSLNLPSSSTTNKDNAPYVDGSKQAPEQQTNSTTIKPNAPSKLSLRSSSGASTKQAPRSSIAAGLKEDAGVHNRRTSHSDATASSNSKAIPSRSRSLDHSASLRKDKHDGSTSSASNTTKPTMCPPTSFKVPSLKPRNATTPTLKSPITTSAAQPPRRASSVIRHPSSTPSTPSRRTSASQPSTARPAFTTHKPTTPARMLPAQVKTYPAHPLQPQLLHLSILHSAAAPTLKSYIASSRASLHRRFLALQETYRRYLELARQERQGRNILSLHRWCNGNSASLVRKLSALVEVAGEVAVLTAEEGSVHPKGNAEDEQVGKEGEVGLYTSVVRRCELWMLWVLEVWDERDNAAAASEQRDEAPLVEQRDAAAGTQSRAHTPIEPLGDAVKADIKALTVTLNRLAIRMEELVSPAPPSIPRHSAQLPIDKTSDGSSASNHSTHKDEDPTPLRLVMLCSTSIKLMQEQLQVMRETEFEVVVGERAWVDVRVRALAGGNGETPFR